MSSTQRLSDEKETWYTWTLKLVSVRLQTQGDATLHVAAAGNSGLEGNTPTGRAGSAVLLSFLFIGISLRDTVRFVNMV
jgi:hypothetical protein